MIQNYYNCNFIVQSTERQVSATKTVKNVIVSSKEYEGALIHLQENMQFVEDKQTVYADYIIYCSPDVSVKARDNIVVADVVYLVRDVNPGLKQHHKEIACSSQK